uniref:Kinesin-like protein n=1 Tax=Tetraselmis sp. GSL018 TaxID=582737 RepID=A0A061RM21_9CHLO
MPRPWRPWKTRTRQRSAWSSGSAQDEDIVNVMGPTALQVNETKVKVDLTKYVERHMFSFDDALDEFVSNDDVYRCTVQPLVGTLFRGGKATCFAYGQTGSGKTYTMSPLPIRAGTELISALRLPKHSECQLWVSNFEIYGGKVFDLLNTRKKLDIREDGKKQVCIVGLKEHFVEEPAEIQQLIEHGAGARSTGSTGANEDSSRSHSIVQFAVKGPGKTGKLRLVGKLSFIDLAGSERGADTYDNDKQTRLEGAEINKSLLALKECIRALDLDKTHVPFRGSKLTEVLRDSFVGKEARTVMIANISPNSTSVEHTLNTLRYADRVKELRKDKQERAAGGVTPGNMGYGRQAAGASTNSRPSSAAQQRPQNQAPLPPVPETGKQVGGSGPR